MTTLPRRILNDAVAAASHGEHVTLTATDQHRIQATTLDTDDKIVHNVCS